MAGTISSGNVDLTKGLGGTLGFGGTSRIDALSNTGFTSYLGREGLDINSLTGEQLDDYILKYEGFNGGIDSGKSSFLPEGMSVMDAGKLGLGIGQLGLGLAGYLDASKTAKKQRELMSQQIANNADLMANRKARNASIQKYFTSNAAAPQVG